jgi:carbonic anhydrase/acetyltransferase-like protein (isoleucine patch superfamily)
MKIDDSVFVAEGAVVTGDVEIGEKSSVWYNAVVRGTRQGVRIGRRTNIQDGCVIHTGEKDPVVIGDDVTVGHMALLHGCEVGDCTLIGMGSTIMNGAKIGSRCIIGAGSLVTGGKEIPDGTMAFGRPAKVIRELTDEEKKGLADQAMLYVGDSEDEMARRGK